MVRGPGWPPASGKPMNSGGGLAPPPPEFMSLTGGRRPLGPRKRPKLPKLISFQGTSATNNKNIQIDVARAGRARCEESLRDMGTASLQKPGREAHMRHVSWESFFLQLMFRDGCGTHEQRSVMTQGRPSGAVPHPETSPEVAPKRGCTLGAYKIS